MKIIWSAFAEKQLDEIFKYYSKNANETVAENLIKSIINKPKNLIKNPFIGQEENLLKERKIQYRYLIYKNYKIIYSVDKGNGFIKIADVFDTRQNPTKIKRIK